MSLPKARHALPAAVPHPPSRLVGDLGMWIVMAMEMLTFGLMFLSYAAVRRSDAAAFAEGARNLDARSGMVNTVLLIGGSWCVVRALQALNHGRQRSGVRWLLGCLALALGFLISKAAEWQDRWASLDVENKRFDLFYVALTGFHYTHVIAAAAFIAWITWRAHCGAVGPGRLHAAETAGVFWHMVDLLWMILFPLLYVLH